MEKKIIWYTLFSAIEETIHFLLMINQSIYGHEL